MDIKALLVGAAAAFLLLLGLGWYATRIETRKESPPARESAPIIVNPPAAAPYYPPQYHPPAQVAPQQERYYNADDVRRLQKLDSIDEQMRRQLER